VFGKIFDSLAAPEQAKLKAEAREEIERRKADAPDYFCNYFNGQLGELERSALSNVMERRYGRKIDRAKNYRQVILQSLDESLRRLGTDHVDVLMCPHGCNTAYEMLNFPETFEAFETARKAGKARFLGVSAHSDPAGVLEAAVKSKMYSVAMVAYNIINHRYVDPALEQAAKAGVGVIAMKVARPVHPGRGRPSDPARVRVIDEVIQGPLKTPQKAYVWALRNRNLSAVISEMENRAMVDENLPLARG
jgi:predicted aldo/keto reductase-like oxidoreductase